MIEQEQRTARFGTVDTYTATFSETERRELVVAKLAVVVAAALARARQQRGQRAAVLVPVSAAEVDPQLLRAYLHELGHDVQLVPSGTPHGDGLKATPHSRRPKMTYRQDQSRQQEQRHLPECSSREDEAAFWETHDIADFQDELTPVRARFAKDLSEDVARRVKAIAKQEIG